MSLTRRLFAILLATAVLLVNGSVAALAENVLTLPSAVRVIEEEAFEGDTSIDKVVLPEGVTTINARAFSDSTLSEINLPASLESIDDSAFDGPDQVAVTAQEGTYAYDWAVENGYIRQPMAWPESRHNYLNNSDETWEYIHHENAVMLRVTFDARTYFEDDYDFLYITDSTGEETSYTGNALAGVTLLLPGHRFSLRLTSDGSVTKYGFTITDITPMSRQEYQDYLDYLAEHPYDVRVMGDGTVEITGYRGMESVLEIPTEIDGRTVTGISTRAFAGNATITEVTIPEGVKNLRSSAFRNCPNLTKVVIPGSVKRIDSGAFYGCASLTYVTLNEGVEEIEYEAFAQCDSLTTITLPASLEYIAYEAFENSGLQTVNATLGTYAYAWAVDHGYITLEGEMVILPYPNDGVFTDSGETLLWDLLGGNYNSDLKIITRVSADTSVEWSASWIYVMDDDWEDVPSGASFITPETRNIYIALDYNMTGAARQADLVFTCGELTRTLTIRQLPFMIAQLTAPADLGLDWNHYDEDISTPRVYYAKGDLEFVWNLVDGATGYEFGLRTPDNYEDSGDNADYWEVTDEDIWDGAIHLTVPADSLSPTNRMDHTVILRVYDAYDHEYNNRFRFGVYDPASPEWGYRQHYAYDEDTDEEYVDGITITGYSGSSATPIVPAAIGDMPVVCLEGAFEENREITGITLPDTLYEIGDYAFGSCENLASITLPSGVTRLGYGAFYGCSSLTEFTIPSGVTYINDSLFYGCTGLTEITIPDGVTGIEYEAFESCTGLTEITIPGSVRSIEGDAFRDCTGLQTLTVLEGVQYIGWSAFSDCSSLSTITLPASTTYIDNNTFSGCYNVTEYIAPEGSYAYNYGIEHGFIHEDYVFESAHPFTDDDLEYHYTHDTEAEGLMLTFSTRCKFGNLNLIYDGGSDWYYGDWQGDNSLAGKTVVIPGNHFDINLTYDGNERWGFGITAIEPMTAEEIAAWREANPFVYQNYNYWDYNTSTTVVGIQITNYQGTATDVVVPATIDGKQVLRINSNVFVNRSDLTSVVVSEGVRIIEAYTFSYCPSLTSVTLPESITEITGNNIYDSNLLVITAPEGSYAWNWAQEHGYGYENVVLESDHPFYSNEAVEYEYNGPSDAEMLKVTFSKKTYFNSLTITLSDDSSQEYNGSELEGKTLYLPGSSFRITLGSIDESWEPHFGFRITDVTPMSVAEYETYRAAHPFVVKPWGDDVTIVDYIGADTDVVIPEYYEGKHVVHISPRAFYRHDELTSVVIPDSVMEINSDAFSNCSNLTSVTLPSGMWYITNNVFYNCRSLESVNIPDSVQSIYGHAFGFCANLASIELSANVNYIDDYAFYNCPNLIITAPEGSYAYDWAQEHNYVAEPAVLESAHPFMPGDGNQETFSYTHDTDADALKLTFSTRTQFDSMILTDAQDNSRRYGGDSLSGKEVVVLGNAFTIVMENWGDNVNFGFRITAIEPLTQAEYDAWRAEHPFITRSYNWDSVTITGYIGPDTDLVIPQYIDGKSVKHLGSAAFERHNELTSVVIPEGVESANGEVFRYCSSLERVVLPSTLTNVWYNMFAECTALTDVTVPEGVQGIYDWAFFGCTSLTSITLPQSINYIEENAFQNCSNLTIDAPEGSYAYNWALTHGFIEEEAAILESAHPYTPEDTLTFSHTSDTPADYLKLTFSASSYANPLKITDAQGHYTEYYDSDISGRTVIVPGDSFTIELDSESNSYYGFRITEIVPMSAYEYEAFRVEHPFLTGYYNGGVRIAEYIGTGIDELVIPSTIDGKQVKGIDFYTFSNHTELTTVVIPSVEFMGGWVFQNCTGLTQVILPSNYTYLNNGTFSGCTSLTNVVLSNNLETICNYCFDDCVSLTSLSLPATVNYIAEQAFEGCTNLTITAPEGSYAYNWAQNHSIPVVAEADPEPLPGVIG